MTSSKLILHPIPALKDNYIWCITNSETKYCLVVDPGDAKPVLQYLQQTNLTLDTILITHHHGDHTAGIQTLKNNYPGANVFTPSKEPQLGGTQGIQEGVTLYLPNLDTIFEMLDIPGHTLGHTAYYNDQWLFCGDTLFSCGCGRIFEGTPEMMYQSLQKLKALPSHLQVCCGHEYTLANLAFALTVLPNDPELLAYQAEAIKKREKDLPTLPSTIARELQLNPFLRCEDSAIAKAVSMHASNANPAVPVSIFTHLREWKNNIS